MSDVEFVKAFKRLKFMLHAFFLKCIQNGDGDKAEQADDLVQETAKRALPYSRLPEYAEKQEWLIWTVARNVLSRHFKAGKKKLPPSRQKEEIKKNHESDPSQPLLNKDRWNNLYRRLDPTTRMICQLRIEGYKFREIAEMLALSEDNVKARIQRLK
ncbi:MAG TPA: sigma-70 family RNA polymerase sigma factor [Puia sp.]|nr:sigma-70 family RNA polymerase sigma factor [Puia sp.]